MAHHHKVVEVTTSAWLGVSDLKLALEYLLQQLRDDKTFASALQEAAASFHVSKAKLERAYDRKCRLSLPAPERD